MSYTSFFFGGGGVPLLLQTRVGELASGAVLNRELMFRY